MSGPVENQKSGDELGVDVIEVKEGRSTRIGELAILRVLPTKGRRTIGPWCFVDLMSPDDIENPPPMEIGPHPHIGLSTVTWLFDGSALHSDSLGTEQLIRPGELNLMSSGHGIAHAELGVETRADPSSGIMGAQMWLAQSESTRHGSSSFQHLKVIPEFETEELLARVFIGQLGATRSGARTDHPTVGADIEIRSPVEIPIDPLFEHAIVPIDRPVKVDEAIVDPGALAIIPVATTSIRLESRSGPARVLLLGGEPLGEPIQMWWNFVARSRDELTEAWVAWRDHDDDRFGPVASDLARIDAPRPPWVPNSD